jgi:hypothetical protein
VARQRRLGLRVSPLLAYHRVTETGAVPAGLEPPGNTGLGESLDVDIAAAKRAGEAAESRRIGDLARSTAVLFGTVTVAVVACALLLGAKVK